MNNYILSPYNLLTRGLRLSTKWMHRRVNKERKTDIKRRRRRDPETQKFSSIITSRRHVVWDWHNNEKVKTKKGSNSPPEHCESGDCENLFYLHFYCIVKMDLEEIQLCKNILLFYWDNPSHAKILSFNLYLQSIQFYGLGIRRDCPIILCKPEILSSWCLF